MEPLLASEGDCRLLREMSLVSSERDVTCVGIVGLSVGAGLETIADIPLPGVLEFVERVFGGTRNHAGSGLWVKLGCVVRPKADLLIERKSGLVQCQLQLGL